MSKIECSYSSLNSLLVCSLLSHLFYIRIQIDRGFDLDYESHLFKDLDVTSPVLHVFCEVWWQFFFFFRHFIDLSFVYRVYFWTPFNLFIINKLCQSHNSLDFYVVVRYSRLQRFGENWYLRHKGSTNWTLISN